MNTIRHFARAAAPAAFATARVAFGPARAEPLVYVPLGEENVILVLDASTDRVVDRIEGTAAVHGLAGTPDGRLLVAGSFAARPAGTAPARPAEVSEDDHAAHHAMPDPAAGEAPEELVSTVSVIDGQSGEIVQAIDVPGAVHHVAIGPDGRFAAVTLPAAGAVSVLDLEEMRLVTTIATGAMPNYAAFSNDGSWLFVSNAGDGTVGRIGTRDWTPGPSVTVGASPEHLVLAPDNSALYVNNVADGSVTEVDPAAMTAGRSFELGAELHGIDLSEDGKALFVAMRGADRVARIELATGAQSFADLAPAPYHLTAIPGTGKLYVSSAGAPQIWVLDATELSEAGRIEVDGTAHQIVVGPAS